MLTRELIHQLPKAELHNHLDGSLRPETLLELWQGVRASARPSVSLPSRPSDIATFMRVDDARDLEEFLQRFAVTIAVLQAPEAIERVAYEMCEDAARDNVRYIEIRYCPALSTRYGLSLDEVIAAEWRGLQRGERDFGVVARIINCGLRQEPPEQSVAIAEASVRNRQNGVIAFDIAGGESGRPASSHVAAFDIAARGLLHITAHAGEAAGPESIADALAECHAERLGHGTRLGESPSLRDYVRDRRIGIEINITSNVQTRVVAAPSAHPVRDFYDRGLNVTLCTDSWLMCGTTLTNEYLLAHTELGFTRPEIDRMILNGFESAFVEWPIRERLIASARRELAAL